MPDETVRLSLISAKTAAKRLGLSRNWLTRMCTRGQLRAVKIEYRWWLDPADVESFRRQYPNGRRPLTNARGRAKLSA